MDAREQVLDILRQAYLVEVDGYTFYSMTAEKAKKPAVRELFEKLASDEQQHQAFLKEIAQNYEAGGAAAFKAGKASDWSALCDRLFTEKFKAQAAGAAFEMGVLSVGMTLETNAIALFTKASEGAQEKTIRDFYAFLAAWEKQHFDALQALFNEVRVDYWGRGGFAAF